MTVRLLLDEHYSEAIAAALRDNGHDVTAVVADDGLRGASDPEIFGHASQAGQRIVTENVRDFRPLLLRMSEAGGPVAPLLLVHPRKFPRGRGDRASTILVALRNWLERADVDIRPVEDWLT